MSILILGLESNSFQTLKGCHFKRSLILPSPYKSSLSSSLRRGYLRSPPPQVTSPFRDQEIPCEFSKMVITTIEATSLCFWIWVHLWPSTISTGKTWKASNTSSKKNRRLSKICILAVVFVGKSVTRIAYSENDVESTTLSGLRSKTNPTIWKASAILTLGCSTLGFQVGSAISRSQTIEERF